MTKRVAKCIPIAFEERVDQKKSGDRRWWQGDGIEPTGARGDLESAIENRQHDKGEPEGWRRDADQGKEPCRVIYPAVAPHRGQNAERNADEYGEQKSRGRELDGSGSIGSNVFNHWALGRDRDAEIAMHQAFEKDEITFPEGQIEAPFCAVLCEEFLVGGGDVAELGEDRITRNRICDKEDDQGCQQRHDDRQAEPRDDIADHELGPKATATAISSDAHPPPPARPVDCALAPWSVSC